MSLRAADLGHSGYILEGEIREKGSGLILDSTISIKGRRGDLAVLFLGEMDLAGGYSWRGGRHGLIGPAAGPMGPMPDRTPNWQPPA